MVTGAKQELDALGINLTALTVFSAGSGSMPLPTRILVGLSDFLLHYGLVVLLGAADRVETSTAIGVALSASFALGVVLWELTTGQRLFRMESDLDTLAKVQECNVARPSTSGCAGCSTGRPTPTCGRWPTATG